MRFQYLKKILNLPVLVAAVLLLGASSALAQQQVNLSADSMTATLPDGSKVPMWGYNCGTSVGGSTATCNPLHTGGGWSPVVITVPSGQGLTINLTNNLQFGSTKIPTSLTIVGQLGGGLGDTNQRKTDPSPGHPAQPTTWPIANSGAIFTPPSQPDRVRSFATEVGAGAGAVPLTWSGLKPGTYLIESGTHPSIQGPMGLYGMLVVTCSPTDTTSGCTTGTAYPGVTYAAELPLLFSEIDPNQNTAVDTAVRVPSFSESGTTGPYAGGGIANINIITAGTGYTTAPTVSITGGGGTGAAATATIDTDPTSSTHGQVTAINITSAGSGYKTVPTVSISGGGGSGLTFATFLTLGTNATSHCSDGAPACYPPAVNYTPLYYLINGVAFDKTKAAASNFATSPATAVTGNVLVRMVNAGLHMHVPSIVGAQTGTAASGFSLIAEDGNKLPGTPRIQSEVFLAPGKTYDVMINPPAAGGSALPVFDRQLSLSANSTARDGGMLAYISVNGAALPTAPVMASAVANADTYSSVIPGQMLTVSDISKGVIANDVNIYGVVATAMPTHGSLALAANGTFTYTPDNTWAGSDSFSYCGNGATIGAACTSVSLTACADTVGCLESASGIMMGNASYTSTLSKHLSIKSPGVLEFDKDNAGYPLKAVPGSYTFGSGPGTLAVTLDENGGFNAAASAAGTYTFTYSAKNSQGTVSSAKATVTLVFPAPSNLQVTVLDGGTKDTQHPITDYRWIIEEDRTFYVDPNKTTNTGSVLPTFGTNFHTSFMPVVATGCTGDLSCESGQTVLGQAAVCDMGDGICHTDASARTPMLPNEVHLDPTKRYYISVLPGDAANPFETGNATAGHGMGGAPIVFGQTAVTVLTQPTPFPPAKLSVFVFEDDFPLNGEQDAGGGVDILAPNEPGLGNFNITIMDDAGGSGDATGQVDYDMFNQPLSNSLAGTIDPATGLDACPIGPNARIGANDPNQTGITGTIVTCPVYEGDGSKQILSPLAGQAIVANMMPGRYGVIATPGADRIARGEEWLQTNTLDGQKAHDSFLKIGEAGYFQEYGPAGYHVSIGFANPKIIQARKPLVCNGSDVNITGANCSNTVNGSVSTERMSRTPDERLYGSGSYNSFSFTQCYVSIGDPDGEDFDFTKCDASGNFSFSGIPDGSWRITVFDQWNDMLVDGLSTPVAVGSGGNHTVNMGAIAMNQWQADIYTQTFYDLNKNGVRDAGEPGLALVPTNIRFRDGSFSNFNSTDLDGHAGFNEVFPLFNWYVVETDSTRYKNTGTHVVYDAGGPADGTPCGSTVGTAPCGNSTIGQYMANTYEANPVPGALHVPGAIYCADADCDNGESIATSTPDPTSMPKSTGRIDPPWVLTEGWQGFSGQNNFLDFGKTPFAEGENGGIKGHVVYASTRPFDDPTLLLQLSWEPMVPNVPINLYQETTAPDGSKTLTLVDTTLTSSFDKWAQGFRVDANGNVVTDSAGNAVPNMNCPGQTTADLFYFTLYNQPSWLDIYNGGTPHSLPNNSQFKCYDGMHNWNQLQPAPYDGMYQFPSIISRDTRTGKPIGTGGVGVPNSSFTPGAMAGTNCTVCKANPTDGTPMLPDGKYVVEVVVPTGYELVKEEDKNILIGDNFIAPVTQEIPGLGSSIFILPDQAEVGSAYNGNNAQNSTNDLGRTSLPSHEADTGQDETYWPCVGEERIVPDFISLFPQSGEVAPFAGSKRKLCDRKEVSLDDQTSATAKFYVFTATHAAAHFAGVITDDFTSEFDPFSPQFGEKFAPPNVPISFKDWTGNEVSRVYSDQWGAYNGLTYSTWEVNPPNPTGYSPTMMVTCMNDPGTGQIPDPLFNPGYSQFCYEIPFMPGQTQYMDTPVTPTTAFSEGYNHPDCSYPDATPAIKEVDGDGGPGSGPYVAAAFSGGSPVASVTLGAHGSNYTSAPTVVFTGGGGSGAAATAGITTTGVVGSVTVDNIINSGYTAATTVTITATAGCGGSGATATANRGTGFAAGTIISFTVTNGGSGYTCAPTVKVSPPTGVIKIPTTATAHLFATVTSLTLTNGGSGYATAPAVGFTGGGGSGATATASLGAGGSNGILTITALGDQNVINNGYSGPSSTAAPFNQKTITRHYGFGGTAGSVTIGGVTATVQSWSDSTITVRVPAGVPNCSMQQQTQYGGSTARCGQLLITAANGKQSIDTVTVTIGGKAPTYVDASGAATFSSIQSAIDAAKPGDLIMVKPGTYNELLLMWKPVRLQGVGAAATVINANTHPEGKLDPWRAKVNCLFGLALNGQPTSGPTTQFPNGNPFDPTGQYSCGSSNGTAWFGFNGKNYDPQVDRLPLEGILGWDTTVNGNLAQLLQEPTLMGAYEGAGITVLGKGVRIAGAGNPNGGVFGTGAESVFPAGSTLMTNSVLDCGGTILNLPNPHPSNFYCNPSSIDGLSITNSSQGGGGVFVHAWGHHLQIANNRIYNNSGTLTGGITVGQGESPDAYLAGDPAPPAPSSCLSGNGLLTNTQLPYCFDTFVNIHHNAVMLNSSIGDELYSSTPAGGGGVTLCTGADYYKFNFNWVCGNLSTGDGGGLVHLGFMYPNTDADGGINHNQIIFNQSTNPTVPTNGGGILVMGAPPDGMLNGVECGNTAADADCVPGLSDGTGPDLKINANLIMGNGAESGSGGGIRLQGINGTEVGNFPKVPNQWNTVDLTNNIIANNVAGWDGGGVSLQDALKVNMVNNTIVSNDSTASSGVLFNTLGAPISSSPSPTGPISQGTSTLPQPAGVVAIPNSPALLTVSGIAALTCPTGHSATAAPTSCNKVSFPLLVNNLIWQNRSYYIGVGALNNSYQQNIVSLYNSFTSTLAPSQPQAGAATAHGSGATITGGTGACTSASYWDIGIRGDLGPGNHNSGVTLSPTFSWLTNTSETGTGTNDHSADPTLVSQYCNGSRTPPEAATSGWQVPPGISDATVPNPIFSLTPSATVDEGNNWVNIAWGPLALTNAVTHKSLGNYAPATGSPLFTAGNFGTTTNSGVTAPTTDFFGNPRGSTITIGAIQSPGAASATPTLASINPTSHAAGGAAFNVTLTGTNLAAATAVNVDGTGITVGAVTATATTVTTTFTIDTNAGTLGLHNVSVTTTSGTTGTVSFTVTGAGAPSVVSITPNSSNLPAAATSTVSVTLAGSNLGTTATSTVHVDGTGVTASVTSVSADGTSLVASFVIDNQPTTAGVHNVSVSTANGTSGAVVFTVNNSSAPTLTSIAPATGTPGSAPAVTLTGANLTGATSVNIDGVGVTAGAPTGTATAVTASFTIVAGTTALGTHNVTVTTPFGTSAPVTFTVATTTAPHLTGISPASGLRGITVPVTLTGSGFATPTPTITINGTGVTVQAGSAKTVNANTITANFVIAGNATQSVRTVSLTGSTSTVQFAVGPFLSSISPANGVQGNAVTVTLTGAQLTSATGITVSGNGITVSGFTQLSDTSVSAIFTIAPNATANARSVTVTTISGNTNTLNNAFTVVSPHLTSIAPTSGHRGTAVPVTITGTNLTGATAVNVSGTGVTASTPTVNAAGTTVTTTLTISSTATFSSRNVTVRNAGGATSNPVTFAVAAPPPTLTSISPAAGTHNTNVPVTMHGTNLTGATIGITGGGVTFQGVNVNAAGTQITATFRITNGATRSSRNVTVNTTGGASNIEVFTVN